MPPFLPPPFDFEIKNFNMALNCIYSKIAEFWYFTHHIFQPSTVPDRFVCFCNRNLLPLIQNSNMDSCSDLKVLKDDRHVLLSVPYVFPSSPQITVFDLFLIWYYRADTVICVVHIMVKIIHISCCLFFCYFANWQCAYDSVCENAICIMYRLIIMRSSYFFSYQP